MFRTRRTFAAVLGAVAVLLISCGSPGVTDSDSAAQTPDITVFAAASLTATFTELADDFETENPGVGVTLNFAGSSDLVTQLTQAYFLDVGAIDQDLAIRGDQDPGQ